MRRYYRQYAQHPAHKWHTQSNWLQNRQQIHLVSTPLQVGQAKYAGQVIAQSLARTISIWQDIAWFWAMKRCYSRCSMPYHLI
ncbi:MAG: hypothetical protein IPL33_06470 [Sphingobacteriales bacterium]|nr:hypothetical protein [Sphingobacteriales bacterium]